MCDHRDSEQSSLGFNTIIVMLCVALTIYIVWTLSATR